MLLTPTPPPLSIPHPLLFHNLPAPAPPPLLLRLSFPHFPFPFLSFPFLIFPGKEEQRKHEIVLYSVRVLTANSRY